MGFHHPDGVPFGGLPVGASFRWGYHSPTRPSPVCVKTSAGMYRKPDGFLGSIDRKAEVILVDKAGLECPACGMDAGLTFDPPGRPLKDGERNRTTCDRCGSAHSVLRDAGGLYVEGA